MHRKPAKKSDSIKSREWWITGKFGSGSSVRPIKLGHSPIRRKATCERKVERNKYERDAPEIRQWWYELFDTLEADSKIPIDEQTEILQENFDIYFLDKILPHVNTRLRRFRNDNKDEKKMATRHLINSVESITTWTKDPSFISNKSQDKFFLYDQPVLEDTSYKEKELKKNPKKAPPKSKMYKDFFKRTPEKAAVWRASAAPVPRSSSVELEMEQMANMVGVADTPTYSPTQFPCSPQDTVESDETSYISSDFDTYKRRVISDQTIPVIEDLRYTTKDVECVIDVGSIKEESKEEIPKCKMFMDFFKRKMSRAAVWRSLPPLEVHEMNLNQKAEAITEKISTDFVDWLRDLGGEEELSLNVRNVMNMFEIGFDNQYAKSLKVEIKELPSVPRRVAEKTRVPQCGKRAVLGREINRDMRASKKKTTYSAFGKQLPFDMQVRPPAENYFKKWTSCEQIPEKLESMATVWEGIETLKSTQAFCQFLRKEKPEIKPPKYLQKCGLMSMKKQENNPKHKVNLLFNHEN